MWNLSKDRETLGESALRVGQCIQILPDQKYVVQFKHEGKYVVGLGKYLAPSDIEEGMRIGC
jgi:26S proteasome regulatory subunit T1